MELTKMRVLILSLIVISLFGCLSGKQSVKNTIENISDIKDFKKILRTKNNVLVAYINSMKESSGIIKSFREAADIVKGQGAMLIVDCSGDAKKLCKKLKVGTDPYILRHYKDGDFHRVYDRKETVSSLVSFMKDPTGDIPWDEDDTATDVLHIADMQHFKKVLRKESRPMMVMFYAPWCGYCKHLKPEYAAAATVLKPANLIMAAMDVNRPENSIARGYFNITGFPTLIYFENGDMKFVYEGENKKDSLIEFMKNPTAAPVKPKDEDWSSVPSDVVHLTTDNFDSLIGTEQSVLVMFYAPWCGHCKRMKPEYEKAAAQMKEDKISGVLAAVDATKEAALAKKFNVRGYPTVKYFKDGELTWDMGNLREADKIIEFMKDPKEPPPPPPPEPEWAEQESEVVHLDTNSFKGFLKKKRHVLTMFYAPWCGHCKMAKPEFTTAAEHFKDNSRVAFAALDCTKHKEICSTVGVSGYPTFKYYNYYTKQTNDEYSGGRKKQDFINFMEKIDGSVKPKVDTPKAFNWKSLPGADKVVELTDSNFKSTISAAKVLLLFHGPGCKDCEKALSEFLQASRERPKDVLFAVADISVNPRISENFAIKTVPAAKLVDKGMFSADLTTITVDGIKSFFTVPIMKPKTEL